MKVLLLVHHQIGLQREDWRQRPLSMEMVQYARTDAHYLLYIAGRLLAELEMLDNGTVSFLFHSFFSDI